MRLVNWRTLVASAASVALVACGDDVTVVQPPLNVTANPTSVSCTVGQQTAVGISATGGNGTPTVAFQASNSNVTVTGSGSGASVTCNTVGSSVINVTVTPAGGGQAQTVAIPVTISAAPVTVSAVLVNPPTATVVVGGTTQLTPSVITTTAGTSTAVTFTSTNTAVATVDNNGVVRGVAPGTAVIRVASVAAPSVVAVATITVVPTSAFVQSLSVNPQTVALNTGGTQTIASNVNLAPGAPAGTSTGVTYTSSDTSVATVSSAGVITARRNGTAVITVASVAAPSVTQTISVTVRDPIPPRLTIQSIRVVNAQGNLVPADLNNVTGNLFVTLNVDPGDFALDSLQVRLGTQRVVCQRLTAALNEALRRSLLDGSADVQSVECQINTSQFNATSGVPDVINGLQSLTAEVFFRPQGAAAGTQSQRASIPTQLTVTNQSGFFVQVTNTPTAAQAAVDADGQATGPQGVLWRAGTINVTVLPVNFTPVQSPGTQTFTISLQDAVNGVFAQRTATQTSGASTFAATFPGASANTTDFTPAITDRTLDGYTSPNAGIAPAFNPQGQYTGGGTLVVVGTAAGTGNTTILNAAGQPVGFQGGFGNTVATPIFVDNQNPQPAVNFGNNNINGTNVLGPPTANFANTGTSFVGFINAAFNFQNLLTPQFLTGPTNAASALTANNPDFGGVDRVTIQFFAGTSTNANTLTGGTAITTGAALSPSTTNTANNLAVSMVDALGNRRNQRVGSGAGGANLTIDPATGATVTNAQFVSFGVDISAPTIAQTAGGTANFVTSSGAAQVLQFAGSDETGFGTNPILVTATRTARAATGNANDVAANNPGATSLGTFCATGVDGAGNLQFATDPGGTCTPIATIGNIQVPAGLNGQYSLTVQARDQAGNLSTALNRIVVIDTKAPVVGGISLPQTLTGNQPVTFTTSATDNLELGSVRGEIDYAALLSLQYPDQTIGSPFDNTFTASNTALAITIPSFIRSVTPAPGGAASAVRTLASGLRAVVADLAGLLDAETIAIPAGNLGNLSTVSPFVSTNLVNNVGSFRLSVTENRTGAPADQLAGTIFTSPTGAQAGSATITVRTTGQINTFVSPFQRLELYVQVQPPVGTPTPGAVQPQYRFLGTVPAGLVQDNVAVNAAVGRIITSNFTLTPTTSPLLTGANGPNTYSIIAVGINANGDALVSEPVQVTINP